MDPVDWARALDPEDWSPEELFRLADAFIREGGARTMMGQTQFTTSEKLELHALHQQATPHPKP